LEDGALKDKSRATGYVLGSRWANLQLHLIVSLRMDAFDVSMPKRIARKEGIPHTQVMGIWLQRSDLSESAKKRATYQDLCDLIV